MVKQLIPVFFLSLIVLVFTENSVFAEQSNIFETTASEEKDRKGKELKEYSFFKVCDFNDTKGSYVIKNEKYPYRQILFKIADTVYREGIIFDTSIEDGYAICNLDKKYSSIEFNVGHINGSEILAKKYDGSTLIRVYYDDEKYPLDVRTINQDTVSQKVVIPLRYCEKLKMQVVGGGGLYAFTNIILIN